MNIEKVAKLASEMLLELSRDRDPENELIIRMAEQRLKTLLVLSAQKKHDEQYEQRDQALQHLY